MSEDRGVGGSPAPFDFRHEVVSVLPHLRAFARGLCGRPDYADDLVQDTITRAWASRDKFKPGTSFKAWTFVILRNAFLSERRRSRFQADYDTEQAEQRLTARAEQEDGLELEDMRKALQLLPVERREALLLVGAGGMSYDEAAEICGCAIGTIRSRVARGRSDLSKILQRIDDGEQISFAHPK